MENKVVPTAFVVTSARVNHYSDVIDSMVKSEIYRCQTQDKFTPTAEQIKFYEKELIRHITIRRNLEFANTIKIKKNGHILKEMS